MNEPYRTYLIKQALSQRIINEPEFRQALNLYVNRLYSVKRGMYKRADATMAAPISSNIGSFFGGMGQSFDDIVARWRAYFQPRGGFTGWLKSLGKNYIVNPVMQAGNYIDQAGTQMYQGVRNAADVARNVQAQGPNAVVPQPKQPTMWQRWFGGGKQPAPTPAPAMQGNKAVAAFGRKWGIPIAVGTALSATALAMLANRKKRIANQSQLAYETAPDINKPDPEQYTSMGKYGMYIPPRYRAYMYKTANMAAVMRWLAKNTRQAPGATRQWFRNAKNLTSNGWKGIDVNGGQGVGGFLGVLDNYAGSAINSGKNAWQGIRNWYGRNASAGGGGFLGFLHSVSNPSANAVNSFATSANNAGYGTYNYFKNLFTGKQPLYNRFVDAPSQLMRNTGTNMKTWGNNMWNNIVGGWNEGAANSAAMWAPKMASYRVRKVAAFIKK